MTTRELDPLETETLRCLWTPDLDPLFWRPDRVGVRSTWYGHVPFAPLGRPRSQTAHSG
jgi:hypothetical protein